MVLIWVFFLGFLFYGFDNIVVSDGFDRCNGCFDLFNIELGMW